jgi:hypothetical protein
MRGEAYGRKGDYDRRHRRLHRGDPARSDRRALAYYGRALAYRRKGLRAAAERDFAEAKRLGYKP